MKFASKIFTALFLVLLMAGCTTEDLDTRITELEKQNAELVSTISENQSTNTELIKDSSTLVMDKANLLAAKDELEDAILELEQTILLLTEAVEAAKSDDRIVLEATIAGLENEIDTLEVALSAKFDGAFVLVLKNDTYVVNYNLEDELSIFELIDNLDIDFSYEESEWGHFVTGVGSVQSSIFKYVSFYKNGEMASQGIDVLSYENGDIISFLEETISWESTFEVKLQQITSSNSLEFITKDNEVFYVMEDDLPEGMDTLSFLVGSDYLVTGVSEVGSLGWGCSNCVIASNIVSDYTKDFTQLYELEIRDEVYLEFTITELISGSQWGTELFAKDINELLSSDVTEHLDNPYSTGYLFYTLPDELELQVGKTYVAKFTFDLYPPNSKGQLGLSGIDSNGDIDYDTVEFYELDDNGEIVGSIVTWVDPNPPVIDTCTGFQDAYDNLSTGDQCMISFTVDAIVWGTPQATDLLGTFSEDVMAYIFDASWGAAEVGKSYTVLIEKQSNNQIKLIGDLTETSQ